MKLFIIHVGYYDHEVGMYELHSQFLIVAPDAKIAKTIAMEKPAFKNKKMHIDGIQEINQIDDYTLTLVPSSQSFSENKIYTHREIKEL